ncbi:hypothetical protein O3P69_014862 [Scylla paramamosain]|uniref:Uncharacterized protein n=1 Tax=Scylla paramamosain TaxID=85552 RepID=A0AAW0TYW3_SCYPA
MELYAFCLAWVQQLARMQELREVQQVAGVQHLAWVQELGRIQQLDGVQQLAGQASQSTARARPVHTSPPLTTYRSPPATWVVLGGSRGVFAAVLLGFIFIGSCPAMADRGLSRAGTPKPSQDTPRRASKPSQDTPRRAPQPSQDTPRRASQASQDTPRRASSSSSVSRDSSRPRRDDDDRLRKDNKRTAVGFDGSSVKRLCASKPQQPGDPACDSDCEDRGGGVYRRH